MQARSATGLATPVDAPAKDGGGSDEASGSGERGERAEPWLADGGLMDAMGLGNEGEGEGATAEGKEPGGARGKARKLEGKKRPAKARAAGAAGAAEEAGGPVQRQSVGGMAVGSSGIHRAAAEGVSGAGGALPYADVIQQSFGHHDISSVQAHTGSAAASATKAIGAEAYATGNSVAFSSSTPSLHTAAHEAAHVVQQRGGVQLKGGVGQVGDAYEQHADAVADMVVQGKDASGLLDQMSGSGTAGVQRKVVQLDIKADLRKAIEGWGTDEAAIFSRLQRASIAELQAVVADRALLAELQDDLSLSDMERVLDLISAPLPAKLRLAMSGWLTNDNDYIRRSLDRATPAELTAAGNDTALVNELIDSLGSSFLKTVLDRIQVPLARKIQYALSGWGVDDQYIYSSIQSAPVAQVVALAGDAATLAKLDDEGLTDARGAIARRIFPGGSADDAFKVLVHANDATQAARLESYGGIPQQRALCDAVIVQGVDAVRVQRAFHAYWGVEVASAPAVAATTNGGAGGAATPAVAARDWPIPTLQAIHTQMKLLPDQDTRMSAWNRLSLTSDPLLINRAAYGGGDFTVGSNASTGGTVGAGYGVRLTADAAVGATTLEVNEGPRFAVGDTLVIDRAGATRDVFKVTAIAANTYTIDTALTHAHTTGEAVTPDDGSALRSVNWLNATVRHEIAHAIDGGSVNTNGFTAGIGGWVLGESDAGFDAWATAMGGGAWTPNDGSVISAADRAKIKEKIVDAVANRRGSLYALLAADPTHPIMANQGKAVPVIEAAEICLSRGDQFYNAPEVLYAVNGKRFTVSWWYKRFQHHNEDVVSQRVANYGLYAPAEFFAEAYTVFYEEAGRPGITDADYGRLIRNSTWRQWIRDNVHNRGLAPAGTGAAPAPAGAPAGDVASAGARPGGAGTGRATGNPGL